MDLIYKIIIKRIIVKKLKANDNELHQIKNNI